MMDSEVMEQILKNQIIEMDMLASAIENMVGGEKAQSIRNLVNVLIRNSEELIRAI
jgi:F0F1-type ATP synthase delta subunit